MPRPLLPSDLVDFKVSGDEYTPAQRKVIDARLKLALEGVKKGHTAGPFDTPAEMVASLKRDIRKMSQSKPKSPAR